MQTYTPLTDIELLTLLKSGDKTAFTEIYNRYWKRLLAIAYNHTKDKSSAEEIVQKIFVSLWERKNTIDINSLNAYLATAVKFSVFKQIHRQKKQFEINNSEYNTATSTSDEDRIDAKFLQEYINDIVEQLPEKCRLVFKLSRNEGLTIPEISKEMGIAEKTVEAHLTKGLKTIRVNLKDPGPLGLVLSAWLYSQTH